MKRLLLGGRGWNLGIQKPRIRELADLPNSRPALKLGWPFLNKAALGTVNPSNLALGGAGEVTLQQVWPQSGPALVPELAGSRTPGVGGVLGVTGAGDGGQG